MPTDPERAAQRIERPHLEAFHRFRASHGDLEAPFYLFFTRHLLHWLDRVLQHVPRDVDVVLVGSALPDEELAWLEERAGRPFHHLELAADDKTVWRFLFQVETGDFGWLDIDCLVLEASLFDEVRSVPADAFANSVWAVESPVLGRHVLRTYCLFLNGEILQRLLDRYPGLSPNVQSFTPGRQGRTAPYGQVTVPDPKVTRAIQRSLPEAAGSGPVYLTEKNYFDTLQVYQLVAESEGYRLNQVRRLSQTNSPEIVHVGKVSYYNSAWGGRHLKNGWKVFVSIALADFFVLSQALDRLPCTYRRRWEDLRAQLDQMGVSTDLAWVRGMVEDMLVRYGAGRESARRLLDGVGAS